SFAFALCTHDSAVHLDKVLDDREAEPEAPGLAAGAFLAKALEQVRKEPGSNSAAGVRNAELDVRADSPKRDLHESFAGRELDGVGEKVPAHLLQARGIAAHEQRLLGKVSFHTHLF